MPSIARQTQMGMQVITTPLTIGITFDTRDDFKFVSAEPEDWDAEFAVSEAVDDIAHALEDLGQDPFHR